MIPHNLTSENYFSAENNMKYMSCSQFKSFLSCEASALAELRGEYTREVTDSLLVGSYVDAHFEGTLDIFKAKHPEIFTQKGELKSQYRQAEYMIQRAERDKLFMQYMSGDKQVIMAGEIAGVPFKIKVDSLHKNAIVDLKTVKDFEPLWNAEKGARQHFINYWSYDLQGAIYREIVRQNTGEKFPFFISAITKEKPEPDLDVLWVPDEDLDIALSDVESLAPRFQLIKDGKLEPQRCGKCAYCRFTKVLVEPRNYHEDMEVYEVE